MIAWKNKHIVIATLMAPVLALIAYFATSAMLGEDPVAAEVGQNYSLVEKPNCRYNTGLCGLKNAEFELTLTFERIGAKRILLNLESVHPLDGVLIAQAEDENSETLPVEMQPNGPDGKTWSLEMPSPDPERHRLHLVASANGTLYFGDAATKFMLPVTTAD